MPSPQPFRGEPVFCMFLHPCPLCRCSANINFLYPCNLLFSQWEGSKWRVSAILSSSGAAWSGSCHPSSGLRSLPLFVTLKTDLKIFCLPLSYTSNNASLTLKPSLLLNILEEADILETQKTRRKSNHKPITQRQPVLMLCHGLLPDFYLNIPVIM